MKNCYSLVESLICSGFINQCRVVACSFLSSCYVNASHEYLLRRMRGVVVVRLILTAIWF